MTHAFGVGLHRVELDVYDFNTRARHIYEKLGFVLEGTKREALWFDDGWVDCHVMGLLASEWRG
jgi:RimJ/RimL family protein N-acetyltransferase